MNPNIPVPQIVEALTKGLDYLILGFQNIGFRRNTKEHFTKVDEQIVLLTQHNLVQEKRIEASEDALRQKGMI